MNVAVVEPTSQQSAASADREGAPSKTGHQAEWIHPEGDDWFASIYRELTAEPTATGFDLHAPELEHWFG